MATNLPTYTLNPTAVSSRASEVTAGQFVGGANLGSSAGNLGIATGVVNPKPADFSRIQATVPEATQHIGGNGLAAGATTTFPLQTVNGADLNDRVAYVEAQGTVANGAQIDATTGAVNVTGATIVNGDWVWGEIPVA